MAAVTKECDSTRNEFIVVNSHCPERPYVAIKVPEEAKSVLSVTFTVVSRDQGWADDKHWSYSSFDAKVARPQGRPGLRIEPLGNNRIANPEFYQNTWTLDLQGARRHKDWIQSLLPGDEIQLIPKATYLAWLNIIQEGSITLSFEPQAVQLNPNQTATQDKKQHYQNRLQKDEIRLLLVKPGTFGSPIHAQFELTKLGMHPDFRALSYCWGNDPDGANIFFNSGIEDQTDISFSVRPSLNAALQHLRSETESLTIWIDAVCIDQDDPDERSQQVAMMSQIYSEAISVHVWLGDGNPAIHAALRVIRDIYNYNYPTCVGGNGCTCPGTKHCHTRDEIGADTSFHGMEQIFHLHRKLFTQDQRDSMSDYRGIYFALLMSSLFLTPWFTRTWVVQEVTLARQAYVHYGREMIDWNEVFTVNQWRTESSSVLPHLRERTIMPPIWNTLRKSRASGEENQGILDVFLDGMDLKATDPRDNLYALLPFGKETCAMERLDTAIKPDYNKPTELVFADFTRWWIQQHQSLAILSAIHCTPTRAWQRELLSQEVVETPGYPTWAVPQDGETELSRANLEARFNFDSAGDTKPVLVSSNLSDPLVLTLQGFMVAEINAIEHPTLETLERKISEETSGVYNMEAIFDRMFNAYGWGDSRVPQESRDRSQLRYRSDYLDHLNAHWRHQASGLEAVGFNEDNELRRYTTKNIPSCADRCFFVASNNMYGLCPWRARKGDHIVLLFGGNVPLLLRPTTPQGSFKLVGECFVSGNGVMNGDYLRAEQAKGTPPTTFSMV